MVGGVGAVFPREGYSMQYAPGLVDKVWGLASRKGYGRYFIDTRVQANDHYFINRIANIPCINIIHYEPDRQDFMSCHHRRCDNLEIIDKASLKAAGQVVLEVVYSEVNKP
jgi:hypothetical protein